MTIAMRPNRAEAVVALQRAIHAFNGHVGKWTVEGNGRNFVALTFASTLADLPEYTIGDEPWDLWGEEILAAANLKSDRTISGEESRSFFASAIIFVED
jgi:hypothetical protein